MNKRQQPHSIYYLIKISVSLCPCMIRKPIVSEFYTKREVVFKVLNFITVMKIIVTVEDASDRANYKETICCGDL